ncbi:MAG: hypothetical protein Kow006_11830 [Gammaproteobacteria bacterium]
MNATRLLPLLLALVVPPSQAADWLVVKAESRIAFTATFEGAEFGGEFRDYSASLRFDPDDLAASRFEVRVATGSATTGSGELDDGMRLPDWFDTATFPEATFVSRRIEQQGNHRYVAEGNLTIKGVTRKVRLPFTWTRQGQRAEITGSATLNRGDFRIGEGEWADGSVIGLEVTVATRLVLRRAGS